MHFQSDICNSFDDRLNSPHLFGSHGVKIVSIRIPFIISAGYGKRVFATKNFFVFAAAPQRNPYHHVRKPIARHFNQTIRRAIRRNPFVKGFDTVHAQGRFSPDQNRQVHASGFFPINKRLPLFQIGFFLYMMFPGRKKEASLAAKIAAVGHIIY